MNKQRQLSLVIEPMFDDFSVNGAVGLRERQYRTPASLAAMTSLVNAASELNDDLRFHQVAEWFGDEFDGPSHRIDIRPEAVAAQRTRLRQRQVDLLISDEFLDCGCAATLRSAALNGSCAIGISLC